MAIKGATSKNIIAKKILETFEGAFQYDKEIRIPIIEDGETIQIKVTLTAAKTNVAAGGDTALPGATPSTEPVSARGKRADITVLDEPTEEEKQAIKDFLNQF
jgi:hypothetical protein